MPTYQVTYQSSQTASGAVEDALFGANALYDVNINEDSDFEPDDGFEAAIDELGITYLRYPGGHAESTIDITALSNGALRSEVTSFLDWAAAKRVDGDPLQIVLTLPTKTDISSAQIEKFVQLVLTEYGGLISGFEIGNEYSIGPVDDDADRSVHPEFSGEDTIAAMNETDYGIVANTVINAVQDGIDAFASKTGNTSLDPDIMLQLSATSGAASDYKGTGIKATQANSDILSQLDASALAAIDTVVGHYYYNDSHSDDESFDNGYQEIRSLDTIYSAFEDLFDGDVEFSITEWGVYSQNYTQLGAASASTMLEMFENMLEMGVDSAYIWPLQHRTTNSIAGNRNADDVYLTMAGGMFNMLEETLEKQESVTGSDSAFYLQSSTWTNAADAIDITHFASDYQQVLYVSLRDLTQSDVTLSLAGLMTNAQDVSVRQLSIDQSSSDGLSDFAGNGDGRLGRRSITSAELAQLQTLAFFDASNSNHVKYSGSDILTYLPPFETIIPLVNNPKSIDDYYFATEVDVAPEITELSNSLLTTNKISLDMMPYDVVEIVITHTAIQNGDASNNTLKGGAGQDKLFGLAGADRLLAGEEDDLLDGGAGADTLVAGSGNDTIRGGNGADEINGGNGYDFVTYANVDGRVLIDLEEDVSGTKFVSFFDHGHAGGDSYVNVETFRGSENADNMRGNDADNKLWGGGGNDRIYGRAGDDTLGGNDGQDSLYGNLGADILSGGDEAGVQDCFVYFHVSDSYAGAGNRDRITDFQTGADLIDLSNLNITDSFVFVGSSELTGTAGQLGYYNSSGDTIIHADLDGDGVSEFEIQLDGIMTLNANNFIV